MRRARTASNRPTVSVEEPWTRAIGSGALACSETVKVDMSIQRTPSLGRVGWEVAEAAMELRIITEKAIRRKAVRMTPTMTARTVFQNFISSVCIDCQT